MRSSSRTATATPVGIKAIGASLGEERGTIERVLEPFLVQVGFVARTPKRPFAKDTDVHLTAADSGAPRALTAYSFMTRLSEICSPRRELCSSLR